MTAAPRVAVLGGGMGGLSCAHELARQGFAVDLYEAGAALGGKARSQYLAGTGRGGRRDLPGEHGFRFYPAFYRHVIATMREIHDPLSPSGTVAGNLVAATEAGVAQDGLGVVATPRRPRTAEDFRRALAGIYRVGGSLRDLARYLGAHVKYLTACDDRRDHELEAQSWARFIGADRPGQYREAFRQVLLACTRTMVAMDAERGSSRTVGRVSSLLLADSFREHDLDRTMMGPTTECWIDPWAAQLERWGVRVHFGQRVQRLEVAHGQIAGVVVRGRAGEARIEADAYVLAVPLEVAHALMTPALADAEPALARLAALDVERSTSWMTGAQFFLREDLPLCAGHLFLPGSPWSLTAISQAQFWNRGARRMSGYGDGGLRGILSVDVSSCFTPDGDGLRLVDGQSREQILRAILRQLSDALDAGTRAQLARAVFAMHLDDDVRVGPHGVENAGRLLVHPPGSWHERPPAVLPGLPNLFLAADYVRTSVDLASMEGANEAGRRAARGLCQRFGRDEARVKLYDYAALDRFAFLRGIDRFLHEAGFPHLFDIAGGALARG